MHRTISSTTFSLLKQLPGLGAPAGWVQGAHDAITHGVYSAVKQGGHALLGAAGQLEQRLDDPNRPPGPRESAVRSALNAMSGNHLASVGNGLAIDMGFFRAGKRLLLDGVSLAHLGPRVCVYVHGLACDENSWRFHSFHWLDVPGAPSHAHYAERLSVELGIDALFLRYNTGLSLRSNAHALSSLLDTVAAEAPQVRELVLIGHSMGGLVARLACEHAQAHELPWLARTGLLVGLGSPHQGAPLERLGHLASEVMSLFDTTRPLHELTDLRSRGVKDLRHGVAGEAIQLATLPVRWVSGSLAGENDGAWGALLNRVLGDGLVPQASAADVGVPGPLVERVELAGLGHLDLLNHPRVYALLREWLAVQEMDTPTS
ncbi:MAG: hypothetical protein RLZZ618_3685 [Pseudomonadota bacterium]|jgi:pimeloyl-ACP methyl ester carboxylesterase